MAEGIRKKVVWNCNEPPMTYFPQKARNSLDKSIRNFLKNFFFSYFERPMVREHIDQIVVLDKGRQALVKKLYGVMPKIVRIGVNMNLYMPRARKNYKKINILFVSRLDKHKRIEDFLAALDILENKFGKKVQDIFEVYVIGAGPQESLLHNFIKNHNTKINYMKNVSDEKVVDIYNKGNILVFPAVNQPWGLVPFEAMACKCAVIVSKDTGAVEVLTHMKNSILISPYNPAEISDWIERFVNDKSLLKRISENGFLFVSKNLTLEKYAAQILELLKS
jgi:glycosyltransferase involved in cell wall biosynthesis